ncbi:MAG TPA: hypothetical protein VMU84_13810 [Thermoanaerobaculia bacterium]|nr:hypothetical protein [Thermoanaerobaculia bacterium]
MMRRSLTLVLSIATAAAMLTGCASGGGGSDAATAKLTKPEIMIIQTSNVPSAARHVDGGLPIQYRVRVANKAGEPITLRRIALRSVGQGAYTINGYSQAFNVTIEPDQFQEVEFYVPAFVDIVTMAGANGPVTLRGTYYFDSPVGKFQETQVGQVNDMPGQTPNAQ